MYSPGFDVSTAAGGQKVGEHVADTVAKSENDKKQYRRLVLSNDMNVLLISDPEVGAALAKEFHETEGTGVSQDEGQSGSSLSGDDDSMDRDSSSSQDASISGDDMSGSDEEDLAHNKDQNRHATKKAAAAMAVGVGSFQDPMHLQGLSHYLEHMLFMGSEKYPDENDYDDFLSKHGGSNNAYTELEYTNFHFDVQPRHLEGALDRFAQFFIAPLCKHDSMEREVMAVESEFQGVLQSDSCRALQLMCHTACPDHVYRKFTWGNKKSLWDQPIEHGLDVRAELLKYYRSTYSADRMNLVVLGGEPLDVLEEWVKEKFSRVPGGLGPRPSIAGQVLPFNGQALYVQPSIKEAHAISIQFQLPSLDSQYNKNAQDYISHLIGHEGKGSLLSMLKMQGFASDVYAGVDSSGYEHNALVYMFSIHITLTEAGLAAAPGAGLAVVALVFDYINMLKACGPQPWIYNELKAIADMRFMFHEEEDACEYCSNLANNLHRYPSSDLLRAESLFSDYDPELIIKLLMLMVPQSAGLRIDLLTASFESVRASMESLAPGCVVEDREPWFDMPFLQLQLPQALLRRWENADVRADLTLPVRNPFIPSDFRIRAPHTDADASIGVNSRTSAPDLLVEAPGLRLWHKMDTAFLIPKAGAYFLLYSPAFYCNPQASVTSHVVVKLLEEELNEVAYLAESADLGYSTHMDGMHGITFQVFGFSHRLPALTAQVFETFAKLRVDAGAFARVTEIYSRQLRNAHMKPGKAASYARLYSLRKVMWHTDAQLAALGKLSLQDVQAAVPELLANLHIEALIHGNMDVSEARALGSHVYELMRCNQILGPQRPIERVVRLGEGSSRIFRCEAKNQDEVNSAVEIYYQMKEYDSKSGAIVSLIDQLISEPFYDTLRTKEQLGYTVHCGQRLTHGVLGFCATIISDTHAPPDLDFRIECFLGSFMTRLKEMSMHEFEQNRQAVISNKLAKFVTLCDETDYLWDKIVNKWYEFQAREKEAQILETITQAEVIAWYAQYIAPSSCLRSKLSVQVAGRNHHWETKHVPSMEAVAQEIISSLDGMKVGLGIFPALVCNPNQ